MIKEEKKIEEVFACSLNTLMRNCQKKVSILTLVTVLKYLYFFTITLKIYLTNDKPRFKDLTCKHEYIIKIIYLLICTKHNRKINSPPNVIHQQQ